MEFKENYGKIADSSRKFDIEFWQEQGDEAIFEAAWQLIKDSIFIKTGNVSEPRIQRTVESFGKIPS